MSLKEEVKKLAEKVYKELGAFGFIDEEQYRQALIYEMLKNGLKYLKDLEVPIMYGGSILKGGKVDLIVFDKNEEEGIIIELKTGKEPSSKEIDQLYNYYKAIKNAPSFPKFIANKIKHVIIINWVKLEVLKTEVKEKEKIPVEKSVSEISEVKDIEILNFEMKLKKSDS